LMTGYADITDEEAVNLGAACVLHKPFERKLLIDTVNNLVNKKYP
jgi:FixJ family two-component response regulator